MQRYRRLSGGKHERELKQEEAGRLANVKTRHAAVAVRKPVPTRPSATLPSPREVIPPKYARVSG
jgi:hypothetical protein